MPTPITIEGLSKRFDSAVAVDGISLSVGLGEMFFLLGPSGCGKTTLLRMIAGFTEPTSGAIRFGGRDVTTLPPERRNAGMVFQSYALWPHMSVAENVEFGLKARKVERAERRRRVGEALDLVRMSSYAGRKPGQLSGGQQQRVALARALIVRPDVLLLDEPLSNLDAKLRAEMREEIRRVCSATGITTVYVTHDQKEALSLADRMAVMHAGRILEVGNPRDLYERPGSRFVAEFLGPATFIEANLTESGSGPCVAATRIGKIRCFAGPSGAAGSSTIMIRPEMARVCRNGEHIADATVVEGVVQGSVYLGEITQIRVIVGGSTALDVFELGTAPVLSPGSSVRLLLPPALPLVGN